MTAFTEIDSAITALGEHSQACPDPAVVLLQTSESILENWLQAHGETPTREEREGFRLLALHRQGAKSDPTFNACRETCREIAYYANLLRLNCTAERVELSAMLARHLMLFVQGKLENSQLGEFCCSSRSLRTDQNES